MKPKWTLGVAFLLLFAVLATPRVVNHTEAEDAYAYAKQVERQSYREILHPNHRLYHPLAKAVYELSGREKSFGVLVGLSLVSAMGALLVFYFLLGKLGLAQGWLAFVYTAGLALSYGFWRYAHEVEIYAVGWLVLLLVLWAVFSMKNPWQGLWAALLLVLALNVHRALGPPLAVTFFVLYAARRDWRSLGLCLLVGLLAYPTAEKAAAEISLGSRVAKPELADFFVDEGRAERAEARPGHGFKVSSLPKAGVGLGASVVGTNLLMGIDPAYELLQERLFPYRFLDEERMMAAGWPAWQIWLWGLGLLALAVTGLVVLWRSRGALRDWRAWMPEQWALLFGAGAYGGTIVIFEPGNPEMWLLGLPFFWLAAACLTRKAGAASLGGMVLFLGLTSWLGGMALLGDPGRDYHRATSVRVRAEAKAGDVYLLGYNGSVHQRFVNYESPVTVVSLPGKSARWAEFYEQIRRKLAAGQRVFVHRTVRERAAGFGVDLADFGLAFRADPRQGGGGELFLAAP